MFKYAKSNNLLDAGLQVLMTMTSGVLDNAPWSGRTRLFDVSLAIPTDSALEEFCCFWEDFEGNLQTDLECLCKIDFLSTQHWGLGFRISKLGLRVWKFRIRV